MSFKDQIICGVVISATSTTLYIVFGEGMREGAFDKEGLKYSRPDYTSDHKTGLVNIQFSSKRSLQVGISTPP